MVKTHSNDLKYTRISENAFWGQLHFHFLLKVKKVFYAKRKINKGRPSVNISILFTLGRSFLYFLKPSLVSAITMKVQKCDKNLTNIKSCILKQLV